MSLLRRLLSPEYWLVSEPGPLGPLGTIGYAALGLAFLACAALALRLLWRTARKKPEVPGREHLLLERSFGWFELGLSAAGLLTIAGRLLGWEGWSARIWPPFLAGVALLGLGAWGLRSRPMPHWLGVPLRVLALLPPQDAVPAAPRPVTTPGASSDRPRRQIRGLGLLLGCCVHLAGIAFVLEARFGVPGWLAPAPLLVLLIPQLRLLTRPGRLCLQALTPLFAGYLATLLWSGYQWLGITVRGWQGLAFPDPMTSLFYVDGILLASIAYSWLCQLYCVDSSVAHEDADLRPPRQPIGRGAWRWVVAILLLATSAWAAAIYLGKRTHGATGSDPYAYAQMAVDLADRGTLLHQFPLFREVLPLGIAWSPLLPSGYHLPVNDQGDSPSVWATGASVVLAGGYRLFGETGLYVTTPIIALLALVATWFLVVELLHEETGAVRYLVAALTVALTATSPEFVDRVLVPMADAPALLFTLLTLLFSLRAVRLLGTSLRRALPSLVAAGLSFAWAYWVRHTQLVLYIPVALALWVAGARSSHAEPVPGAGVRKRRFVVRRLWPILTFSASAMAMAIPDTVYRWRVFGGLFATETTELPSMALRHIGPMALQTLRDTLVASEWGYLFPFALAGFCLLLHRRRRPSAMLVGAFVAVLLVHLTYRFLRLRDLISLFPLVNLAVGYGAVSLVHAARARALQPCRPDRIGPALASLFLVAWAVLGLALARWTMIDELWEPGWASFGYMSPDQRAAFDRLAELTPPNAVIGASLNSGAVTMYTGRDSVRPYEGWSAQDWATFVERMESESRPVYLLDDGSLMSDFLRTQQPRFRLTAREELAVPLFGAADRSTGWLYELEGQE